MPSTLRGCHFACERRGSPSCRHRVSGVAGLFLLAFAITGCGKNPVPLPAAADARAPAPPVSYRSTTSPFNSRRPVEPAPWREQNNSVAPAPKP